MLSVGYKRYALAAMTTLYTVNLFDRGLMLLLLQPIKEDLQLSDTQLGLVTGIAFALFYSALGIPIARWADRGNRVTIMALAMALWGITSMLYMFVSTYVHLLLTRVMAGVGDSGGPPPIYSLLGDYFPEPAERTHAMYVWSLAGPLAGMVSFAAAGWLNEHYGWRFTFLLVGLLGLALSIIAKLTLIEPRAEAIAPRDRVPGPRLSSVLAMLWNQQACRNITLSLILLVTVGQGVVTWQSAFMIRHHGIGTAELGVWMGLIMGGGGTAGVLLGKFIVKRWFAADEQGQMRLAGISIASSAPIFIAFLLAPSKNVAFFALLLQMIVVMAFSAPIYSLLQRLVPNEMRATVMTVQMFFANLIGIGAGPLLVGVLSDLLRPAWGGDGLRIALLVMSLLWIWAGYHLLMVGRTIKTDLAKLVLSVSG